MGQPCTIFVWAAEGGDRGVDGVQPRPQRGDDRRPRGGDVRVPALASGSRARSWGRLVDSEIPQQGDRLARPWPGEGPGSGVAVASTAGYL